MAREVVRGGNEKFARLGYLRKNSGITKLDAGFTGEGKRYYGVFIGRRGYLPYLQAWNYLDIDLTQIETLPIDL